MHFSGASEESTAFWNDPDAAMEIAIDMPTSQRGWKHLEGDMTSYFLAAMRKRAVELNEKKMDAEPRA